MNERVTNRLVESLAECKELLERLQMRAEGEPPWPEIERAGTALDEFRAQHAAKKSVMGYDIPAQPQPQPDMGKERGQKGG